jgi:hypothetical protein
VCVIKILLPTGETEVLGTNLSETEIEWDACGALNHKGWGIELKQELETKSFSGRLVDNVKQDFYAMMTVATMLASCVHEATRNTRKTREDKENIYEYKVIVNHAVAIFKDRLIRMLIEEERITRCYLLSELVRCMERRGVPIRPIRNLVRKTYNRENARFHHNHTSNS